MSSDLFYDAASIDYPILDADAHVYEPPDTWQARVAARFRDQAPRLVHAEEGDVWLFDGGRRVRHVGLMATSGLSYLQFKPIGQRYEGMRPGFYDPRWRLRDLDVDGIYAQIQYPSVCEEGARMFGDERLLQLACVRAYNEWLREFCAFAPDRLIGQAVIPATGVADATAELEWALRAGFVGVLISSFPNGSVEPSAEDDRFWAVAEEAQVPVAIHIGSFAADGPALRRRFEPEIVLPRATTSKSGANTVPLVARLIFSGMFERFPRLRALLVEANIGWIPCMLEQADDMFLRYRWFTETAESLPTMPSRVFHRNFWATFMVDKVGIELRHHLNLDHIMWSTDYPHTGAEWPNSRMVLERTLRGLPKAEVRKLLHENCKRLYRLDTVGNLV